MSIPIIYTKELIRYGLGYGLYYSGDSVKLQPGQVGYFNQDHNFVSLGGTGWEIEGLCTSFDQKFGVKYSRGVSFMELGAKLLAKLPFPPGVRINAGGTMKCDRKHGAACATRGFVRRPYIEMDEKTILDWMDGNMENLINLHQGILKRPIWLITSTVDAEEFSNNAWEEKGKTFDIGLEAGEDLNSLKIPFKYHVASSTGGSMLPRSDWQNFVKGKGGWPVIFFNGYRFTYERRKGEDSLKVESQEKTVRRITKGSLFHRPTGVERYNPGPFKKGPSTKKPGKSGASEKTHEQETIDDPGWKEILQNPDEWQIVNVPPVQNVDILRNAYPDAEFALGGDISCLKLGEESGEDYVEQETISAEEIDSIDMYKSWDATCTAVLTKAEIISPPVTVHSELKLFQGTKRKRVKHGTEIRAGAGTPDYEVRLQLKPCAVLNSDSELTDAVMSAFSLVHIVNISIQFLDTDDKHIYNTGWSTRIRKSEDKNGFELAYKRRYTIANGDIDTALVEANNDGFNAHSMKYEAQVEWGNQKRTLSITHKKTIASGDRGLDLPTLDHSRKMLIDEAPDKFNNWKAKDWGTDVLKISRIFGPVVLKRYFGIWDGMELFIEVWPLRGATGTDIEYIIVASFKAESRAVASLKEQNLAAYLQSKDWFLARDSLKTQLIMERY